MEAMLQAVPLIDSPTERGRYETILAALRPWKDLFADRRVLDFGASYGTSAFAMIRLGARQVVGVETESERVEQARKFIAEGGFIEKVAIFHSADTSRLPFRDGEFSFVLVNAVLEHIPQPRDRYLKEIWRVLAPGGHVLINETPNKYFPREIHTTDGLWFNHWLPRNIAHRRAVKAGRFASDRTDWDSSGWRGVGYFEIAGCLTGYKLIPELTHRRHFYFNSYGIPPSIIDPYPTWVFKKP